jgi:NitT/TauT family transport system ATP-binding protein
MSDTVVRLEDVGKTFRLADDSSTDALRGIELTIERGEFVSLIGPSGCGKSTLLRLIGDLIRPSQGRVTVNGKAAH